MFSVMRPQRKLGTVSKPLIIVRKKKRPQTTSEAPPQRDKAQRLTPPITRSAPAPTAKLSLRTPAAPRPARSVSPPAQTPPVAPQPQATPLPPNRRQRKAHMQRELLDVFRARWPVAFPRDPRHICPLMRGVHREMATLLPGIALWRIKRAIILFQSLSGGAYWRAVMEGGPRYALDGSLCGEVTPHEREHATQTLAALAERRQAPRPAAAHRSGTIDSR